MTVTAAMASPSLAFLQGIGVSEMVVILLVVLVLFGGKKVPELAKGLGRGIRQFREEYSGIQTRIARELDDVSSDIRAPAPQDRPSTPASGPAQKDADGTGAS